MKIFYSKYRIWLFIAAIVSFGVLLTFCTDLDRGIRGIFIKERGPSPLLSLREGDRLFDQLRFSEAALAYERILEEDPAKYETLWRLARCYNKWGIVEKKNRRRYVPRAITYAKEAVRVSNRRFEGHLYLSESLGTSLKYESVRNKVRYIKEIKAEAERAIELGPSHYRAYLVLGMWHSNVAGANWLEKKLAKIFLGRIPEASLDEAVYNFKRSIEIKSDFLKTHYELALIYIKLNDHGSAMKELKAAIACPVANIKERNTRNKSIALLEKLKERRNGEV